MLALTLWQPWATLVVAGAKPYEFRGWPLTRGTGIRWAVHAATRPVRWYELAGILNEIERGITHGMDAALAQEVLRRAWADPESLPLGAVLGTVLGGAPVRASVLFANADPEMWANPVRDPEPLPAPVSAKGRQGWWNWERGR
jgi:hypothetical protein